MFKNERNGSLHYVSTLDNFCYSCNDIKKKNDGMKASYLCNSHKTYQYSKTFPNFKNSVQYKNYKKLRSQICEMRSSAVLMFLKNVGCYVKILNKIMI